jgi:hypothetical protein
MAGPAQILREIHRLRRHVQELQAEIDRGPRLFQVQQARVAKQEEAVRATHEALKRLKVTTHDKEVSLKAALQQIAKYERQLNEAATKKEYDALQHEIAAARATCRRLEDEVLEAMAETEDRTAQVPELEQAAQRARDELAQFERDHQARLAGLAGQRDQAQQALYEVEASLPAAVRAQYDRLLAARGADALAAVERRTCMTCYTEITQQAYHDLTLGQFVLCKSCGRMLYLAE